MLAAELLGEVAEHLLLLLRLEVEPWLANHAGLGLFEDLQGEAIVVDVRYVPSFYEVAVLWHIHKLQAAFVVVGDHLNNPLGSLEDHHLKTLNLKVQE